MQEHNAKLANIRMLEFIAHKLGDLCNELVFLGGCTTALFITDTGTPDVRYTLDVDCIADVFSRSNYHLLEKKLRRCGFSNSPEDEFICRWRCEGMILDVMPTNEEILGFSNRWYKVASQNATKYSLTDELTIRVVTAPYYLATKLEASFAKIRSERNFHDALPGHFIQYGKLAEERIGFLLEKIQAISDSTR